MRASLPTPLLLALLCGVVSSADLGSAQGGLGQKECAGAGCAATAAAAAAGGSGGDAGVEDSSLLQFRSAAEAVEQRRRAADEPTDPCDQTCGGGIPDPEVPGNDNGSALASLLKASVSAVTTAIGGSVALLMDTGLMILDGAQGSSDPSPSWVSYNLQKSLQTMQDYLVCEMRQIVGSYFAAYMEDISLDNYNNALQALQGQYDSKRSTRQCLNLTDLPGNDRNQKHSGCCYSVPEPSQACEDADMEQIKIGQAKCAFASPDHAGGVCGTDRMCWGCTGSMQVIDDIRALITSYYANPYLSQGNMLNGYNNVDAMTAYAKGTTFVIFLYQSLTFLGASKDPNGQSVVFAKASAEWLQTKVDTMMSEESRRSVVESASVFEEAVWDGDCEHRAALLYRNCQYRLTTKPGYTVRYGCTAAQTFYSVRLASNDAEGCGECLNSDAAKQSKASPSECTYTLYKEADYGGSSQSYTGNVNYVGESMNDEASSIRLSSGCQGVQAYGNADYTGKGEWYTSNENWVGKSINDYISAVRVWTDGRITNTETGCVCEALQPDTDRYTFDGGPDYQNPKTNAPYHDKQIQNHCPDEFWSYTEKDTKFPQVPGDAQMCEGWSKSVGGFTNYGRSVQSFDTSANAAMEKLKEVYTNKLSKIIAIIASLNAYVEAGGVNAENFGAYNTLYPASA